MPSKLLTSTREWGFIDKFCFFSNGPINEDLDVYFRLKFGPAEDVAVQNLGSRGRASSVGTDGSKVRSSPRSSSLVNPPSRFLTCFARPSQEVYMLSVFKLEEAFETYFKNDQLNNKMTTSDVEELERSFYLTPEDFEGIRTCHLGQYARLPAHLTKNTARWELVVPRTYTAEKDKALARPRTFELLAKQKVQLQAATAKNKALEEFVRTNSMGSEEGGNDGGTQGAATMAPRPNILAKQSAQNFSGVRISMSDATPFTTAVLDPTKTSVEQPGAAPHHESHQALNESASAITNEPQPPPPPKPVVFMNARAESWVSMALKEREDEVIKRMGVAAPPSHTAVASVASCDNGELRAEVVMVSSAEERRDENQKRLEEVAAKIEKADVELEIKPVATTSSTVLAAKRRMMMKRKLKEKRGAVKSQHTIGAKALSRACSSAFSKPLQCRVM